MGSCLAAAGGAALAEEATKTPAASPSNELLIQKVERMEARIRILESQLHRKGDSSTRGASGTKTKQPKTAAEATPAQAAPVAYSHALDAPPVQKNKDLFGVLESPVNGLKIGAYGEIRFGYQQNPAANGNWQSGFDMARMVLLPSYQFTNNIIFNSEIEFEHAGSGFDNDDKLHGTAEIEQAYVDFLISPYFNIRAPGIDLVPIDWLNLHHEPTLFYSVRRPPLDNGLIPTTWKAPATSIHGQIVEGLNYQFQISAALEDFGDNFALRTDANSVPLFPNGYAAGIDGKNALGFSQAPLGDFRQLSNYLGYTFRLSYAPSFLPGFDGGSSVYYTPNTTPRGAYSDTGALLGRSSLTIATTDFRYHIPDTGLEFRGEFTDVFIGNPANLRANNDSDPTNNVGKTLLGVSGEVAYHIPLGQALGGNWEAVPFYRYTFQNFQTGGFVGTDANLPTGSGKMQYHNIGVAFFPTPELVLKFDYTKAINAAPGGAQSDTVLGGVGFFF